MASTDILPFGTGDGANVMSQAAYAALSARTAGFSTGVAQSQQLNKVWRQSSFVAAGVANWIVAQGISVPDDGSITGFVTELTAALTAFVTPLLPAVAGVPTGSISAFGGTTVPAGWLECNGAAVSRTTYAALFSVIGTAHGAGDGSTTFNVPDLRGEFVRGWDHGRGVDPSRALGSSQADSVQNITGSIGMTKGIEQPTASGAFQANFVDVDIANHAGGTQTSNGEFSFDASRVARTSSETRPRNIAMMYIIKT